MGVIFQQLWENKLKLTPSKCKLFQTEIAHHVSKNGITTSQEGLKAIAEFGEPQTYTQVREFLGLVGHYRCFIKGFSKIAHPLNLHLEGENSKKKEFVSLS